jgi:hypothetical protein
LIPFNLLTLPFQVLGAMSGGQSINSSNNGQLIEGFGDKADVNGSAQLMGRGYFDSQSVDGTRDTVQQYGNCDGVSLSGHGLFGLFGSNNDLASQQGCNDQTKIAGSQDVAQTYGDRDTTSLSGDNIEASVDGCGDSLNLNSTSAESVKVFGDGISVAQQNGVMVATDQNGNPVPITQNGSGYTIGQLPPASSAYHCW